MGTKHTPGPWVVVQEDVFPFDIKIVAEDGTLISRERRYAYSSKQESIEDVMTAFGFPFDQRDVVSRANEAQLANAVLMASAPDLVFQLLAAANYIDALGGDSKSYRSAISKATGEQQ